MPNDLINKYFFIIVILAAVWTVPWKGFALWKSARYGHNFWFLFLLIINTLGILEMLYIFIFSELGRKNKYEEENVISRPQR